MKVHGGDIYSYIERTGIEPIDFSANINPLGLPEGAKKAIIENIDRYSAYPDIYCRDLTKAVSKYEDIDESFLLFGNGAADIIFKIVHAVKPRSALLTAPTFAEYEIALSNIDCRINRHFLLEEDSFSVSENILDKIKGKDIVFLCNPNNPTGMITKKELMLEIGRKCRDVNAILVIDECFIDFVIENSKYSFKEFIEEFDNVIILRAFTKFFAMAGLRLGYCISSNEELLMKINNSGQPWSVSTPAQVAGVAACSESKYVEDTLRLIEEERSFLENGLKKAGLKVFKGYANYIMIKGRRDLYDCLLKENIIIRSCGNYIGLDDSYFRLAIRSHEENKILMEAIKNG